MKRTLTKVLTTGQVLNILARHIIAMDGAEVKEDTQMEGELMAVANKGQITQYRVQITFEAADESWRG